MHLRLSVKSEVGKVLSGTLRLVRKLADGGMGSVWIAEHLVLGTEVAVKFVSGPWASLPNARPRFLREARMTAKIESPHVVRVLDCRHDQADEPYLVMELLHGETLEQRVRKTGAVSVFELVEIVAQACEGLSAAHAAGIVHRDLKPENVFLVTGPNVFVKLLDFGVAKPMRREDCLACDDLPAGTPQYMSPEHMFEPATTDERSDLFSLAAVAYFAITRRAAFDADSLEGLYFAIDGGSFTRPSAIRPELPAELDAWFEKALAHDPERRFTSAREMADALFDAVRGSRAGLSTIAPEDDPPSRRMPTEPELMSLPFRRLKKPRTGALAVLAAAVAVAGMFFFAWHETGPEVTEAVAASPQDGRLDGPLLAPLSTLENLEEPFGTTEVALPDETAQY